MSSPVPTAGDECTSALAPRVSLWSARHCISGDRVVVKFFDAAEPSIAEREAAIAQAVVHPHVLVPCDTIAADGDVALVFPWCAGGSLADLLAARRRVEWPEALTILIPLADALAAAHERGFVHGDVSAGNVLFDEIGRPLLADFGASRAAAETGAAVFVTPTDVAPEVVRGAVPSEQADLFSLGSVALACLTGRSAWMADDLKDVMIQSAAGQWPEIDDAMAPPRLCEIVRRLLDARPADRGSAAALALELREIGDPEPVLLPAAASGVRSGAVRAATMVRPDATRPPAARLPTARRMSRQRGAWSPVDRLIATVRRRAVARASLRRPVVIGAAALIAGAVVLVGWPAADSGADAASSANIDPVAAASSAAVPAQPPVSATAQVGQDPVVRSDRASLAAPAVSDARKSTTTARGGEVRRPQSSAVSEPATSGWLSIVIRLDSARAQALVSRRAADLADVYVTASPPALADAARIEELRTADLHVTDASHTFTDAYLIDRDDDGNAVVEVVGWQRQYAVLDSAGDIVGGAGDASPTTVRMSLATTPAGYRIARIAGS